MYLIQKLHKLIPKTLTKLILKLKMMTPNQVADFIKSLKRNTEILMELRKTLEKSEKEGYLSKIHFTLNEIFRSEMLYIVYGQLNRNREVPVYLTTFRHNYPDEGNNFGI